MREVSRGGRVRARQGSLNRRPRARPVSPGGRAGVPLPQRARGAQPMYRPRPACRLVAPRLPAMHRCQGRVLLLHWPSLRHHHMSSSGEAAL